MTGHYGPDTARSRPPPRIGGSPVSEVYRQPRIPPRPMSDRIVLEAGKADQEYFKDLWRFRELFYVLAWRDISVRYKQTFVGVLWAVLRPGLSTLVFTVVFGRLGRFPSG